MIVFTDQITYVELNFGLALPGGVEFINLPKNYTTVEIVQQGRISIHANSELVHTFKFTDVAFPVAVNTLDLVTQLSAMLNNESGTSGLATEATLLTVSNTLTTIEGDIADLATEATLQTVSTSLISIDTDLDSVSTEVTSVSILNAITALDANLEVILASNKDFIYRVAEGEVPGYELITRKGKRANIAQTEEVLWEGNAAYPWLTSAQILQVSSSSVSDTAAGIGARTVRIKGLDFTFNPIEEIVVLNGQTPVNTVNSYYRINFFIVLTTGSTHTNVGNIYLGNGVVVLGVNTLFQGFIPIGVSINSPGSFTVPIGKKLIFSRMALNVNSENISSTRPGVIILYYRDPTTGTIYNIGECELREYVDFVSVPLPKITAGYDLWFATYRLIPADNTINAYVFFSALLSDV